MKASFSLFLSLAQGGEREISISWLSSIVMENEMNLEGTDVKGQYLDILSHRKLMREVINAKEAEIANV